jgi:soluble lytic murein transglycosylase-like protein
MITNEQAADVGELRLRPLDGRRERAHPRTIVIRHGSAWQSLAFLLLCLLLLAAVLLGHQALRGVDAHNQQTEAALSRMERKIQQLESGVAFDSQRRYLLLGMRDHILKVNPRVSLADAYRYAELALAASEKYPAVDPLLLLAIGIVESRYDAQAKSRADARGLYQIWPSTGRLLLRALGWDYDEDALYDPDKNTQAAALYLDILFSTYNDPQMVLAEYNGGPLNAGFFRAGVGQLAAETRNYVPRVLEVHARLRDEFERGALHEAQARRDGDREGKTLAGGRAAAPAPAAAAVAKAR